MTGAVALAHKNDKKSICRAVNGLFHNYHLDAVEDYINFYMRNTSCTELFSGDPAVVMYVKAQENPTPLHWNAETLVTNHFQCNYWGKRGASRAL